MNNKIFYTIIVFVCLTGVFSTCYLVKYTVDLSKKLSITSYISNEE